MNYKHKTSKQSRKYGTKYEKKEIYFDKKRKIETIRELYRSQKYDLMYKSIINYINEYGEDCYVNHEYSKYYLVLNEFEKAKEILTKIVNSNSENKYYAYYDLAKANEYLYNYEEALENLFQIINSKHPEKYHALLKIAKLYYIIGNTKESDKIIKKIVNNNYPNKQFALEELLEHRIDFNNKYEAEKIFSNIKDNIEDKRKKIYLEGRIELLKGNIFKAKELLESILTKNDSCYLITTYELAKIYYELEDYNNVINLCSEIDTSAGVYYVYISKLLALSHIKLKNIEETKKYLDYFKERQFNESYYNLSGRLLFYNGNYNEAIDNFKMVSTNMDKIYYDSLLYELYSYIKLEKYEEAYKILDILKKEDNKSLSLKIRTINIYLNKVLKKEQLRTYSYKEKQIEKYDRELAIEHIKLHIHDKDDKLVHTLFNSNIDLNELYDYCYNNLNEKNFYANEFCDEYIIPYENVGFDNNNTINYVKVVTIPNTKDIITIYPYDKFIVKTKSKIKEKVSRIDKFKQKYQIN